MVGPETRRYRGRRLEWARRLQESVVSSMGLEQSTGGIHGPTPGPNPRAVDCAWRRRCQEGYNETAFWEASLGARRRADWRIKGAGVKNPFSTMPGK